MARDMGTAVEVVAHAAVYPRAELPQAVDGTQGKVLRSSVIQNSGGQEVGRRHHRVPVYVERPVNKRGLSLEAPRERQGIVLLIGILATIEPALRLIAENSVHIAH